ncbi:cytochrome b558/566 subunit B [Metallosphaera tengchongensis]|uniref:Cytochrome b558/566 subunit B n=1 Tax=Metallosphaera tengchongensis TaxID=1532350 RepID=A0A6N0NUA3_9CREN|nr:cytochrome b558/566 subunit B [Metallosphaera tengchongensis]QKR00302.1 cytochrome b558/566 subunit B [Metallosphaera tengchongensis]
MSELRDEAIKLSLIFLGIGSIFQFILQFIFSISYLPVHVPFQGSLTRVGQIGLYMSYLSLSAFLVLSWDKAKALLPLGILLLISPSFTFINNYFTSPWWISFEVAIAIIGISGIIESLLKSSILSVLNVPTIFMVVLLLFAGLAVDIVHVELFINYLILFEASLAGLLAFTVVWSLRMTSARRALISYVAAVPALFSFLPIYFLVSSNRFMEIIMNMVMPSVFGIVLSSPYSLPLFIVSLAISMYLVATLALSRNPYAALGYFMVVTTTFLGVNGYHLILYLVYPIAGVILINIGAKKGNLRRIMDLIKPRQNNV